jgi:hypothetical protein
MLENEMLVFGGPKTCNVSHQHKAASQPQTIMVATASHTHGLSESPGFAKSRLSIYPTREKRERITDKRRCGNPHHRRRGNGEPRNARPG